MPYYKALAGKKTANRDAALVGDQSNRSRPSLPSLGVSSGPSGSSALRPYQPTSAAGSSTSTQLSTTVSNFNSIYEDYPGPVVVTSNELVVRPEIRDAAPIARPVTEAALQTF